MDEIGGQAFAGGGSAKGGCLDLHERQKSAPGILRTRAQPRSQESTPILPFRHIHTHDGMVESESRAIEEMAREK